MNAKGVFTALIAVMVLAIVISNFFFVQVRNSDLSVDLLRANAENVRKDWINARVIYSLVSSDAMADLARINCVNASDYFVQIQGYYDVANDFLLDNYGTDCQALISKNLARDKGVSNPDLVTSNKDFYIVLTCQRNGITFADNFRLRKIVQPSGSAGSCRVDVTDGISGILEIDE